MITISVMIRFHAGMKRWGEGTQLKLKALSDFPWRTFSNSAMTQSMFSTTNKPESFFIPSCDISNQPMMKT